MTVHEHEFEAARGLPEPLPPGEHVVWQGAPDWRVLARRAFHLRKLALYFGVLIAWRLLDTLAGGGGTGAALRDLAWTLPLAAVGLGLVAVLAWLSARSTCYTLTERRLVMRVGIVLSVTFNLPLRQIESAALRLDAKGADAHGDIALALAPGAHIAYLHLWPHVRPWHLRRTQPMLRALPHADLVARRLAAGLSATGPGLAGPRAAAASDAAPARNGVPLAA